MKKIYVVVLVLLACALFLGIGGGVLLESENTESFDGIQPLEIDGFDGAVYFQCPVNNPNCGPG